MTYTLHTGDCRDVMATLPADSVDAIVCDPPYGLSFMGKGWDHGVPGVDFWVEALRVLKPGGHLIAFGGTRTYHRLAVAIEDAGFEVRDCLMWLYGSGFPKSLDVSKAMDKQAGAVRDVVDKLTTLCPDFPNPCQGHPTANGSLGGGVMRHALPTAPSTDLAKQWHGWGTAAKPAVEPAILAYKPHTGEHGIIVANLEKLEAQLWLLLFASTAEQSSTLNQNEYGVALSIAQWTAAELINTRDVLCGQMDMSQYEEALTSCLNIVTSWKSTWVEASNVGSTFITETVLSSIINWITLRSSLLQITPESITKEWMEHGTTWLSALNVGAVFNVASKKLKSTLELFAVERAIENTFNPADVDKRTAYEPAILARKPLRGTVADNVAQWGTGGLNIDGCRVGNENTLRPNSNAVGVFVGKANEGQVNGSASGRWPSNVILDEEAAAALDAQSGGASRFFYTAKASRSEREAGLDGVDAKREADRIADDLPGGDNPRNRSNTARANHHPTVKPIALMRYMIRLVAPRGAVVLDPFMGSGSTGCAAMVEGMQFIGIDITPEYVDIARRRLAWWSCSLDGNAIMKTEENDDE